MILLFSESIPLAILSLVFNSLFTMKCPICGSTSSFLFDNFEGKVFKCLSPICQHAFLDCYNAYWKGLTEDSTFTSVHLTRRRLNRIQSFSDRNIKYLNYIKSYFKIHDRINILDWGCGDAYIFPQLELVFQGSRLYGFEPSSAYRKLSANHGYQIAADLSELEEANCLFDYVQLLEVIEHISNPIDELSKIRRLMSPGSFLFISTPLALPYSIQNDTYNVRSHLHFFTAESLNLSLNKAGFSSLSRFDINFPLYKDSASLHSKGFVRDSIDKLYRLTRSIVLSKFLRRKFDVYPLSHISGVACISN